MDSIRMCPHPGACVGGNRVDHYCREGHEGPLCAVCSKEHYFHTVKKVRRTSTQNRPLNGIRRSS